ncbi:uncharacterized protein MYCFIDRAFT_84845, partial [Pseudocercospora fijiensis CIRAD86]
MENFANRNAWSLAYHIVATHDHQLQSSVSAANVQHHPENIPIHQSWPKDQSQSPPAVVLEDEGVTLARAMRYNKPALGLAIAALPFAVLSELVTVTEYPSSCSAIYTSGSGSSAVISTVTVSPTPFSDAAINNGAAFAVEIQPMGQSAKKRQAESRTYLNAGGYTTTDPSEAVQYSINDGVLSATTGGSVTADQNDTSVPFAISTTLKSIRTRFFSQNLTLNWNNTAFEGGSAEFYMTPAFNASQQVFAYLKGRLIGVVFKYRYFQRRCCRFKQYGHVVCSFKLCRSLNGGLFNAGSVYQQWRDLDKHSISSFKRTTLCQHSLNHFRCRHPNWSRRSRDPHAIVNSVLSIERDSVFLLHRILAVSIRILVYLGFVSKHAASSASSAATSASSVASSISSAASSASSAAATNTESASCPASDGTIRTYDGEQYTIGCGSDTTGDDVGSFYSTSSSYEECFAVCASYSDCQGFTWYGENGAQFGIGSGECYFKGMDVDGEPVQFEGSGADPSLVAAIKVIQEEPATTSAMISPTPASSSSVAISSPAEASSTMMASSSSSTTSPFIFSESSVPASTSSSAPYTSPPPVSLPSPISVSTPSSSSTAAITSSISSTSQPTSTPASSSTSTSPSSSSSNYLVLPSPTACNFGDPADWPEDDSYCLIPLPTPMVIYGNSDTQTFAGTNGYISLGQGSQAYEAERLPSIHVPPATIAPFFDDLAIFGGQTPMQGIFYQLFDDGVTYEYYLFRSGVAGELYHFTVEYKYAKPGVFVYSYLSVGNGNNGQFASVGMQGNEGSSSGPLIGFQYSYTLNVQTYGPDVQRFHLSLDQRRVRTSVAPLLLRKPQKTVLCPPTVIPVLNDLMFGSRNVVVSGIRRLLHRGLLTLQNGLNEIGSAVALIKADEGFSNTTQRPQVLALVDLFGWQEVRTANEGKAINVGRGDGTFDSMSAVDADAMEVASMAEFESPHVFPPGAV